MKSYASIDRIEGNFAVCELEMIGVEDSRPEDYAIKETEMVEISLETLISQLSEVFEGDIIVVEHENGELIDICCKDDKEKERRIQLICKILED